MTISKLFHTHYHRLNFYIRIIISQRLFYAQRKIAQGKPKRLVVNNVNAKLIQINFAVAKRKFIIKP
jgi:hypothetical protein